MQVATAQNTSQFPAFRHRLAEQMADYRRRLAERLVYERERKSFSQGTLALEAGVNEKTIRRIEEQEVDNPRPVTIRRLADALGIEPDELRPPAELEEDQLNQIIDRLGAIEVGQKTILRDLAWLRADREAQAIPTRAEAPRSEPREPAEPRRAANGS